MARIRTIKPEFFRDEDLQDLERANPGKHIMLVFAGLWGHCDKTGAFEWKPRTLKLDILPFLDFDMDETLNILQSAGFLQRYSVDDRNYGYVPTFLKHQRISGKEAQEPRRFPEQQNGKTKKQRGSTREATGKHQGRQEGNGVQEGNGIDAPLGADDRIVLEFEQWYALYPNRQARPRALKAYRGARAKVDHVALIAGVERYIRTKPDWQDWAHPATWLNNERWLDEPTATPPPARGDANADGLKDYLWEKTLNG